MYIFCEYSFYEGAMIKDIEENKPTSRRDFIKTAFSGLAGMTFLGSIFGCATRPDTVYEQTPGTGTYGRGPMNIPTDGTLSGSQPVIIHEDGTIEAQKGKGKIKYGGGNTRNRRDSALDQANDTMRDANKTLNNANRIIRSWERLTR